MKIESARHLNSVGDKGRPKGIGRKLLPHEEQQVRKDITDKCPEQLKLAFALWTRQAVQVLIKQNYSVELTLQAEGKYLKRRGFSSQKPIRRAYERNDERVRAWLQDEYPAIASKIHWGDETGLRSDDANGRSYSPKGKTPVQKENWQTTPKHICKVFRNVRNTSSHFFKKSRFDMHHDNYKYFGFESIVSRSGATLS